MLRPAHGARRIERHDLAYHQPVGQRPNRRQVLFGGSWGVGLRQQLHVGGHHHRFDAVELLFVSVAPVGSPETSAQVRLSCVLVSDRGGEEFPEAFFGSGEIGKQGRGGAGEDASRN